MKTLIIVFLIVFIISVILYLIFIPILKKIRCKQQVLNYVKVHSVKNGTPTMGGIIFVLVAIIFSLLLCNKNNTLAIFCLAITFSYMVVGFLDDFIKVKNKQNLGLKAYQKIIFQISIAIVVSIFCLKNSLTIINIPFTNKYVNLRFYIIPLAIFVFLATTNTVNLTDGLDGLAGSVSVVYLLAISILIFFQLKYNENLYLLYKEYLNLVYVAILFVGSILGFLVFNFNKASVFMGDTGSLALGGLISCISIFSGNLLYIPLIGVCFVISGLSVIIQVLYFKITKGKRVFLMAPIHHHFQMKGHSESKIVYAYLVITIISSIITLINYI